MKNAMLCVLLSLAVTTGLFVNPAVAAETGKAQTVIRNGEHPKRICGSH